jgi:putative SOS response-associated peptidase YedK
MPVILLPNDCPVWLGEAWGQHAALMPPAADGVVRARQVSRAVHNGGTANESYSTALTIGRAIT